MTQPKFSFSLAPTSATPVSGGGLFGSVTSTPAASSSQPSLFGSPAATTATTASTGFGGFGAASAIKPATSNPFGTTITSPFGQQQAKPTFGGFGQSTTTSQPATNLFGSTATTQPQTSSIFSFSNQPQQQQQQQQQQQNSLLGNTTTAINQTAQPQPAQTSNIPDIDVLTAALSNASVYNDERDLILAKWNQLQAFYGFGKVFYQNQALDITKDSRLSRFKSISYNCRPQYKNEDGLVTLVFSKSKDEVQKNQTSICETLHKTFNSDQSLSVKVESIKGREDPSKSELVFYVEQRLNPMTQEVQRVASTLVCSHLKKVEAPASTSAFMTLKTTTNTTKQMLDSIGVVELYPLVGLTDEHIKKYLDMPPLGLNPVLWEMAKKNNPNPKKLLPTQISGFQEVNKRFKLQGQENECQKVKLEEINEKIDALNERNKLIKTKIEQMKGQNENLEQRILKVIINYEIRRKIGIPIHDGERYLLNILESFQIELNSPINKEIQRQKFYEFTESIKTIENSMRIKGQHLSEQQAASQIGDLGDVQKSLREQQKAFKSLIEIVNSDLKSINLIRTSL